MFWIYNIHTWLFFIICNVVFVFISLLLRSYIQKRLIPKFNVTEKHNDLLNYFVIALGAFYSITLGLISVDTWEYYKDSSQLTHNEAAFISSLYQDISYYPEPVSEQLQQELKKYVDYVVHTEWDLQRDGVIPQVYNIPMTTFQKTLYSFQPDTVKNQLIHSETLTKYNDLIKIRLDRLNSIREGLPSELWLVIFTEAFLLMFLFGFFVDANAKLHKLLILCLGIIVGTTIFLVAAMNYPYRGDLSVTSEPFELVLNEMF